MTRSTCSRCPLLTLAPSSQCPGWSWVGKFPSAAPKADTLPPSHSTPNPSMEGKFTGESQEAHFIWDRVKHASYFNMYFADGKIWIIYLFLLFYYLLLFPVCEQLVAKLKKNETFPNFLGCLQKPWRLIFMWRTQDVFVVIIKRMTFTRYIPSSFSGSWNECMYNVQDT